MRILAFDSSGAACSACAWENGAARARRAESLGRGHAERLMPMIEEVLAEAGWRYGDLDLLAATTGPGTFTGLRIGLAALRALALVGAKPMLGVTSLEAVAHATEPAERAGRTLLVALESKRADLYVQSFDAALAPLGEPASLLPGALAEAYAGRAILLAGDAAARAFPHLLAARADATLAGTPGLPDAAIVAALAAGRAASASRRPPQPLYLRPPDVTLPAAARDRA